MKRFIKYIFFALVCISFTSCANAETKQPLSSTTSTSQITTTTERVFDIITGTNNSSPADNSTTTILESAATTKTTVKSNSTTTKPPVNSKTTTKTKTSSKTTTLPKQTTPYTTTKFVPVVNSYFNDAIFVGDSVSLKLKLYCLKQNNNGNYPLGHATFFTAGSFGWNNSLWSPSSSSSVHPMINGRRMSIADAVKNTNSKKVFIMLGINDLGPYGPDGAFTAADTVVKDILKKVPDAKIFIQSVTPIYPGCERGRISNSNVIKLNNKLKTYCKNNNYTYLDIWSVMGGNYLLRDYCSDPNGMGIHFTDKACKKWIDYLNNDVNLSPNIYTTTTTVTTKKPVTTTTTKKVTVSKVTTTTPVTITTSTSTTTPVIVTDATTTSEEITTTTETEISDTTTQTTTTSFIDTTTTTTES